MVQIFWHKKRSETFFSLKDKAFIHPVYAPPKILCLIGFLKENIVQKSELCLIKIVQFKINSPD